MDSMIARPRSARPSHFDGTCGAGLWWLGLLLLLWLMSLLQPAHAEVLRGDRLPAGPLGLHATWVSEADQPLDLAKVRDLQRAGRFRPLKQAVPTFGIGPRPVWLRLELLNPTREALPVRLSAGTTWIDHIDVYLVQGDSLLTHRRTGDAQAAAAESQPAIGFVFDLRLPPGRSELYLRAATPDPLVLPVELASRDRAEADGRAPHYAYGFLYGFLIALIAYNGMLYAGLQQRSLLYYALYLVSFILANVAYTGHGYAWWWSGYPGLQRYVILVLMVLYGCCGLLFASHFLQLSTLAPRIWRGVQGFSLAGLLLITLCIVIDSPRHAALVAFVFVSVFTLGMVGLGVLSVYRGRPEGRHFLAAVLCGMLGASSTLMSVWGWIPFTTLTYHGVEIGLMVEATLLALALAYQIRHIQKARLQAEYMAWRDPLTGLYNRRAFFELALPVWHAMLRKEQPISVLMLDIDHFKQINDSHGHAMGDQVLVKLADLLLRTCRNGDIVSRWGGEEFVLLLPETGLEAGVLLAERIRQTVEACQDGPELDDMGWTVSIGVAERGQQGDVEALIRAADRRLYVAKEQGRNRVVGVDEQAAEADALRLQDR